MDILISIVAISSFPFLAVPTGYHIRKGLGKIHATIVIASSGVQVLVENRQKLIRVTQLYLCLLNPFALLPKCFKLLLHLGCQPFHIGYMEIKFIEECAQLVVDGVRNIKFSKL